MDLQQKITHYSIEAYNILGIEIGQIATKAEVDSLREAGNMDAYFALNITYARQSALLLDAELAENAPCYKVCEALRPAESAEDSISHGLLYLFAMHHFMTPQEEKIMAIDMEDALNDNNPYVKKILEELDLTPKDLETVTFTFD